MVPVMLPVFQTFGKSWRYSAFEFSDTTGTLWDIKLASQNGRSSNFFYRKFFTMIILERSRHFGSLNK